MRIAIHQPQYMPWIGYFNKITQSDIFVFLDNVQFKKNEWQHRNRIRNSKNWQWLSIPNSYSFPQLITEVKTANNEWQKKHFRSIQICYGKAPFYKEYIHEFEEFYSQTWNTIDKVSIDSIRLLLKILGISVKTEISSHYKFNGQSSERLVNICRHFNADVYLAGAGGKNYMDVNLFERSSISVEYQDFHCPVYKQHWSKTKDDFIPDLSILDLIFNCGPHSLRHLQNKCAERHLQNKCAERHLQNKCAERHLQNKCCGGICKTNTGGDSICKTNTGGDSICKTNTGGDSICFTNTEG